MWNSVGIVRSYGLGGPHLEYWQEQRRLSLVHSVQTISVAHPGFFSLGTGGSLPGVKLAEYALTTQHYSILDDISQ
jgi:hypothetical protein